MVDSDTSIGIISRSSICFQRSERTWHFSVNFVFLIYSSTALLITSSTLSLFISKAFSNASATSRSTSQHIFISLSPAPFRISLSYLHHKRRSMKKSLPQALLFHLSYPFIILICAFIILSFPSSLLDFIVKLRRDVYGH